MSKVYGKSLTSMLKLLNIPDFNSLKPLLEFEPMTVYVSGSQYDGFGHAESDIDVFVVSKDKKLIKRLTQQHFVAGDRIDIEYWPLEALSGPLLALQKFQAHGFAFDAWPQLRPNMREFLHRTLIANPITNPNTWQELKSQINPRSLAAENYWYNTRLFFDFQEDTSGLLESDELLTALLCSRIALERALDTLLHAYGETNPSAKWIFKKLQRAGFHTEYEQLRYFMSGPIQPSLSEFIRSCLSYAVEINIKAQERFDINASQ
jgi:hypothetical protein